jgi:hypothetical protein
MKEKLITIFPERLARVEKSQLQLRWQRQSFQKFTQPGGPSGLAKKTFAP